MTSTDVHRDPLQPSLFPDLPAPDRPLWRSPLDGRPRRIDQLMEQLPTVLSLSEARRHDLIDEGVVADYLALRWVAWEHGRLVLTPGGEHVRRASRS